ncbi:hypothetical protein PANT111_90175 [Pantoea brenneri]|uniref:Transposase n=1 Tax=Pantoea brenneri TaxID=472694 RepID=A0AAX3JCT8_9GAMM|nr:hypothetical protein PANT111_90175 [Pantoea brenneri]
MGFAQSYRQARYDLRQAAVLLLTKWSTFVNMLTTPWAIAHILASKMRPLANALIKCYG